MLHKWNNSPSVAWKVIIFPFPWSRSGENCWKRTSSINVIKFQQQMWSMTHSSAACIISCFNRPWDKGLHLKGIVIPTIKILSLYTNGGVGEVFESTKHFWSYRAKQRCYKTKQQQKTEKLPYSSCGVIHVSTTPDIHTWLEAVSFTPCFCLTIYHFSSVLWTQTFHPPLHRHRGE